MKPRLRARGFAASMSGWVMAALALQLVAASTAVGATPEVAVAEIGYLLDYIGVSGCEFYRNGHWYASRAAEQHLRDKYLWLAARDRIRSAEEFIDRAATRSSLSGDPYAVRCVPAAVISSNQWLHALLVRYREAAALGVTNTTRHAWCAAPRVGPLNRRISRPS